MKPLGVSGRALEFLAEPSFLLRRGGEILCANAPGRRLLEPAQSNFFDHVASPHDAFDAFLGRSSGSTAPLVGSATLRTSEGTTRFRLHCAALADRSSGIVLALRCFPGRDQFSVLGMRLRDLNAHLRTELREKAALEEALRHNHDLLRELQHRVKNNVQMMESLIRMSAKSSSSEEVRRLVEVAGLRLQAMAKTQDAIYGAKQSGSVPTGPLIADVVRSIAESFGASDKLQVECADAELSYGTAHCLALIANELTTNAIKHGLAGNPEGSIRVRFGQTGDGYELLVHDSGPGLKADATVRSSGIGLVRALCRQIGGMLEITNENGAKSSVRFVVDRDGGKA